MLGTGGRVRDVIAALLARPDEIMLEIGAGGELMVARLRVVIAAMLLVLPVANALGGGSVKDTMIGLSGAIVINIFAHLWLTLAQMAGIERKEFGRSTGTLANLG